MQRLGLDGGSHAGIFRRSDKALKNPEDSKEKETSLLHIVAVIPIYFWRNVPSGSHQRKRIWAAAT
jgi:hypothetical protein